MPGKKLEEMSRAELKRYIKEKNKSIADNTVKLTQLKELKDELDKKVEVKSENLKHLEKKAEKAKKKAEKTRQNFIAKYGYDPTVRQD